MSNYILVNGEPVLEPDILKWAKWFDKMKIGFKSSGCLLTRDEVSGVRVSTVFLGIDHNFDDRGPPVLWETMVFSGPFDGECVRYTGKADAIVGHAAMVKRVLAERRIAMRIWRFLGRITRRFSRMF